MVNELNVFSQGAIGLAVTSQQRPEHNFFKRANASLFLFIFVFSFYSTENYLTHTIGVEGKIADH